MTRRNGRPNPPTQRDERDVAIAASIAATEHEERDDRAVGIEDEDGTDLDRQTAEAERQAREDAELAAARAEREDIERELAEARADREQLEQRLAAERAAREEIEQAGRTAAERAAREAAERVEQQATAQARAELERELAEEHRRREEIEQQLIRRLRDREIKLEAEARRRETIEARLRVAHQERAELEARLRAERRERRVAEQRIAEEHAAREAAEREAAAFEQRLRDGEARLSKALAAAREAREAAERISIAVPAPAPEPAPILEPARELPAPVVTAKPVVEPEPVIHEPPAQIEPAFHLPQDHAPDFEESEAELEAKQEAKLESDVYAHEPDPRVVSPLPHQPRRDLRLWVAVFLGPAAWFTDLVVAWMAAPAAHHTSRIWTLRGIHLAAILVAIGAVVLAVIEKRKLPERDPEDVQVQRARFLSRVALALSAFAILQLVGALIPTLLLTPGAEP
ncbi:MAG TPA: hypothetical protein VFQ53_40215 [Kofleriaceae bacterium]|nr:hypothetical protein [Kofleriaceae bacterium]